MRAPAQQGAAFSLALALALASLLASMAAAVLRSTLPATCVYLVPCQTPTAPCPAPPRPPAPTPRSTARFLCRRFLRIWPMLGVAILYEMTLPNGNKAGCQADWWAILTFTNNYVIPSRPGTPCLGQTWSVAVEFQFYLLSPLIMWAAYSPRRNAPRRFGLAGLALGSLLGPAVALALDQTHTQFRFGYTFTVIRSSPYFAGLFCSQVVQRVLLRRAAGAQQLPSAESSLSLSKSASSSGGGEEAAAGVVAVGLQVQLLPAPAAEAGSAPSQPIDRAWTAQLSGYVWALGRPWVWPACWRAGAWLRRLPWQRIALFVCDWSALALGCTLAWTGVGPSR